ncbi:MAG: hypothetical protein BWY32_03089 [bacterium ADurb.Bin243]|nr:MAG: hypothetical protein BWY32_03089 [bacterium ADurb.Bin243]
MGFYFRKSKKIGPFRINFSNKGIGFSSGVKGARISTNSKGTYINMGSNGLYYREKIGPGIPQLSFSNLFGLNKNSGKGRAPNIPNAIKAPAIDDGVDINNLLAGSNAQLVTKINDKIKTAGIMPLVVAFIVISGFFVIVSYPSKILIVMVIAIISFVAANIYDNSRRTSELFYDLDDPARDDFDKLNQALCSLSTARLLWQVNVARSATPSADNKYGLKVTGRRGITLSDAPPLFIETNLEVFSIDIGEASLYFLPDRVLVCKNSTYASIGYGDLKIKYTALSFAEYETVPDDAGVISQTYLHANSDGSPDKRYSNNPQIPVVSYGLLKLYSTGGLEINLMVSNNIIAEKFFNDLSSCMKSISSRLLP